MKKQLTFALAFAFLALTFLSLVIWQRLTTQHVAANSVSDPLANSPGILESTNTSTAENERVANPHFEVGSKCALCHNFSNNSQSQRDSQGRSVGIYNLWESSMMAQSSRDPYWRAVVSAEVAKTPSQKDHIEEVCTRCHTPMAAPFPPSPEGEVLTLLQNDSLKAHLALDGVSCSVCHQITEANLGTEESFTGRFEINTDSLIFGPHANPVTMPMQRHVNYTPTHSPHILKSALCASCHTVITEAFTADGGHSGVHFHEQAPYLEWRNSVFNDEIANPDPAARSCQSCHMPTTDIDGEAIKTRLAHNPGGRDFPFLNPREPFGRHTLVGGNALMTRILRDNAQELGINAPRAAFDASLEQIQTMLRFKTAKLEFGQITTTESQLQIPVKVINLSGHKFPTAYPSRRAWIALQVFDADSQLVLTSGAFNAAGELVDDKNEALPQERHGADFLPHYEVIENSTQVQIYETIMGDVTGNPTFYLLNGATFLKDNRLLPQGWTRDHAHASATGPAGIGGDTDFVGGSDQVVYRVLATGKAPYRIEATLYFQSIAPRHAAELFVNSTPEVQRFQQMYHMADKSPELVDEQVATFYGD